MPNVKRTKNYQNLQEGVIRTSFQTRDSIEPTYTKPESPGSGNSNNSKSVGASKK